MPQIQPRKHSPVVVNPVFVHPQERRQTLSSAWKFKLDPEDRGLSQGWFRHPELYAEPIQLPGTWQGQGFGGSGKDTVRDFNYEARTFRATYAGTGWYSTVLEAPAAGNRERSWLLFGAAHPSADVWLNGEPLGSNGHPFVPFGFEVSGLLEPSRANHVSVRVHEKGRELGFCFNFQGTWSGLYRGVELRRTGPVAIEQLLLYPDARTGRMRIVVVLDHGGNAEATRGATVAVAVAAADGKGKGVEVRVEVRGSPVELELEVPSVRLWCPERPALYRVDARVELADGSSSDAASSRTGFVSLSTQGKHFCINGEPYYIRASGEFISSPETAAPDADRDRWRRKLQVLRDYGYNFIRCQSFAPTPEYLDAADEVGLLVQSEMGTLGAWGGSGVWHVYQWPQPTPDYRHTLKEQWDTVVLRDVNHPSANIYCMSNEFGSFTKNAMVPYYKTVWQCARDTKRVKPTAFVIWTDGGWNDGLPGEFVNDEARIDAECAKPVIQHEFRWWSSFPDVRIMHKYSGAVRPYAAEMALEAAARHGFVHVLPEAAVNSQRLQYIEAREKMDDCRRAHPTLAGICHFDAMDANPSPQGIVDEFYDRKYADAATWLRTNGDTVLLTTLPYDHRVFAGGERLECEAVVSDYSHPPFRTPVFRWSLRHSKSVIASGSLDAEHRPFRGYTRGKVSAILPEVKAPLIATLRFELEESSRKVSNEWTLWVFPSTSSLPDAATIYGEPTGTWLTTLQGVKRMGSISAQDAPRRGPVLTERIDDALLSFARAGGRGVVVAAEGLVRPMRSKLGLEKGRYFFTPPANYPPYEDGLDGTIIRRHPMLGDFPHEGFADLQFYRILGESPPIDLEPLGLHVKDPVLRAMHTYMVGRPLGYLVEIKVGTGGLVLCSLGLDQALPEARYLLQQICRYAAGDQFRPELEPSGEELEFLKRSTVFE